jgi:hypothetical protein
MIRLLLPLLMLGVGPVAVVEEPMPTDALMRTLAEGDLAQARGDQAALAAAADNLNLLGARPAEGQDDLSILWSQQAQAAGAVHAGPVYRGRALGPAYRRGSLAAGGRVTLRQLFLAGQRAQISVARATGVAASLSVRVRNADGGTLCAKPVAAPQADCAWLPLFTERYAIEIENGGSAPATFYLVIR